MSLILIFQLAFPSGLASSVAWRVNLDNAIQFQRVVDENIILVGTERHLFALDMRTGNTLWRFRNLQVDAQNILIPTGLDVLVFNEGWGGDYKDRESNVLAVDLKSGTLLWESPTIKERVLTVVSDLENSRVLMVAAQEPHGKDAGDFERKPRLYLLNTSSGEILWKADFDREILLSPIRQRGKNKETKYRSFDLAAYHPPVFHQDRLFVLYDGIRCYDAHTGSLLWQKRFDVFEGDLALSYAEPVFDAHNIYLAGEGKVRALRLADGKEIWKTDDYGIVTEIYSDDDLIYGKLGGQFFDFDDEDWRRKGPFGVVVLDRASGKKIWKWDNGDDAITNLLVFGDRVYFADQDDLIALDRHKGKELYKEPHKFDRAPRFIGLNESDLLVLSGDENVAGFRFGNGKRVWFHQLEPPGIGFWKRLAAGFLATTGAVLAVASYGLALNRGLLPAVPSPVGRVFNFHRRLVNLGKDAGKGLIGAGRGLLQQTLYAQLDGTHQYFFTKLPQEGKGLLGVNLTTGLIDQSLPLKENDTELVVSESQVKVFQPQGSELIAYTLRRAAAPALK